MGGDAQAQKATYPALFGIEKSKEYASELLNKAAAALEYFKDGTQALSFVIEYLENQIAD